MEYIGWIKYFIIYCFVGPISVNGYSNYAIGKHVQPIHLKEFVSGGCGVWFVIFIWAASWQIRQNSYAPSEDSDQPGYPSSLIRVFTCAQWVAKGPMFLNADGEESDQTGRMLKLVWVFAGRTCHFVRFVMRRLKFNFLRLMWWWCWMLILFA